VPDSDDDMYERKVIDESRVPLGEIVPGVGTQLAYLLEIGDGHGRQSASGFQSARLEDFWNVVFGKIRTV
jgi:hypothetical protein